MDGNILFNFWLIIGLVLMLGEFILPGLVVMFIGLGSLSVAGAMYHGYIDSLAEQLILFFSSSLIYLFTLRLLVLRFLPSDSRVDQIDEDKELVGETAVVIQVIEQDGFGRISHGGTTWQAKSENGMEIKKESQVIITKRENITFVVKESSSC